MLREASPIEMQRFTHPRLDLTIDVPMDSVARVDLPGVALAILAPVVAERPGAFRANLNLVVEAPDDGVGDLADYHDLSWSVHEKRLDRLDLLDREDTTLAGRAATRVLAHHLQGGVPLLVEQWRFVVGRRGWTLSSTLLPLQAPRLRPLFLQSVESLELGPDA